MPCGVWSRPRRASPSCASSSKDGVSRATGRPIRDQHGVAVAVEPVAGGDGVRVGVEHPLAPGEGRNQEEQRRAWQVEVREERVDRAEPVSGHDGEVGPAGSRGHAAIRGSHGLEHPDGRRPHRHHAAALAPGAADRRRRGLGDLEPLRLHPVLGNPLGTDGPEGPRADVERHPVELDAPRPEGGEQRRGEVKACRRRGHGAGPGRVDGLVARPVLAAGLPVPVDVRRERRQPMDLEERLDRTGPVEPDARPPQLLPGGHGRPGSPVGQDNRRPDRTAPGRTEERGPRVTDRVEQQHLDVALGTLDSPEEPGGQDPRVVHHEAVPRPQEAREVAHPGIPERVGPLVENEEARRVARLRRLLGDPVRGQRVVELGEVAGDRGRASQCGFPAPCPGRDGGGRPCGRRRRPLARAPRRRRARSASAGS